MAIVTFSKTTPAAPGGSDNVTFQTDGNPNPRISANVPEATTGIKGLVKLAGDLAGTSALPTVPGLAAKAPLASPTFTGTVTVPAPPVNATDAAAKSYVDSSVAGANQAASLSTAGQGYFFGPGVIRPLETPEDAGIALNAAANKVVVFQMVLPFKITLRNCSWQRNGGTTGKHHSFGIYDVSGNLLLQATFTNGGSPGLETASFTAVVLTPGVYYFVQTDEDAATSGWGSAILASANVGGLMNLVATRLGVAANNATAGVLPGTLGAITPLTTAGAAYGIAMPLWEP